MLMRVKRRFIAASDIIIGVVGPAFKILSYIPFSAALLGNENFYHYNPYTSTTADLRRYAG